jgi:O-acetyl-ADP-ribose deacetylase (regulator of RNase III)
MKDRIYQFASSSLTLRFGDITTSQSQVIVSSDDAYITMGGGVSASIRRAGGQEIIIDAAKKVPANVGDVVVTSAGRLRAQYIFHAITISRREKPDSDSVHVLRKVVPRCFDLLDLFGLQSIAFPAIGAGVAGFSYEDVAVEMANIIAPRLTACQRALDVTIFLFDRFGQMQPIDFLRFFEEFRVRVPDVATHEVATRRAAPPSHRAIEKRTEPISPRRRLLLSFDELNNERTSIEERLARIVASGDTKQSTQIRKRLDKIQNERLKVLVQLEKVAGEKVSVFVSYSHKDQRFRSALKSNWLFSRGRISSRSGMIVR